MASNKTRQAREAKNRARRALEPPGKYPSDELAPDHMPPDKWDYTRKPRKLTDAKVDLFLLNFADTGNITTSAKFIGVHPESIRLLALRSTAFRKAMELAKHQAVAALEEECRRRAVDGVAEPQFYKGEQVATINRYSDRLLEFLLMAHGGEKYAKLRKGGSHPTEGGGGISITIQNFGDGKPIAKIVDNKEVEITAEDAEFKEEQEFEQEDNTTISVATPPVPASGMEVHGAGGQEGDPSLA